MTSANPCAAWLLSALGRLLTCELPSADEAATRACVVDVTVELIGGRPPGRPDFVKVGVRTQLRYRWREPQGLVLGHSDMLAGPSAEVVS